ncbi:hypothetical protein ACQKQD_06430 [Methylobacterium sp. NPDC080182]|uniref:hypothetical protein n=1 Tax=Methylobacterium sp. NPDC080182 TaxID=3390590 RepID=UPI003CFFCB84
MRRWPEVLLTLVLFAVAMAVVSWVVNATVPGFIDWLDARIGSLAVWAGLTVFFVAALSYGIYDHRRAGRKPKGT